MLEKILNFLGIGGGSAVSRLVLGYLLGGGKGGALAAALPALIDRFKSAGLGHLVESWVGTGPNAAATPEQIKQGIGVEKLSELAKQAGIPVDQLAEKLAKYLPQIIDKLTPGGKMPS